MESTLTELRVAFFKLIFGEAKGFVCIATGDSENARKTFKQRFFHWPSQVEQMNDFVNSVASIKNVWFCVNLLDKPERRKESCLPQDVVWADLDTCHPSEVEPYPSLVIRSSPHRFQAVWKLNQTVAPEIAEDYSRRIAYAYNKNGADPSGWDLTQLLRVPFTKNFKYSDEPLVHLESGESGIFDLNLFEAIEAPAIPTDDSKSLVTELPEIKDLPDADKTIVKYQSYLERSFFELHQVEPDESSDWSTRMWKLINVAFEAGMEADEVFSVALTSKCNKYQRDNRPLRLLWNEVLKAKKVQDKISDVAGNWEPLLMPELVDIDSCSKDTFIDQYKAWATNATDAIEVYHEIGAAMLLSATLAGHVRIETSYGDWAPNLWAMILGESTLTRKSTAMGMVMSILQEVDPDILLATDGSAEGILSSLAPRSGRVSLFFKDEVSGLFDSINRKDYLAGIPEAFTLLYDGSPVKRTLRKEEIFVQNPVFLFFGGGIKEKTYSMLNDNYVLSGFLPRFLVVSGENDLSRLRRTGPANQIGVTEREKILNRLRDLQDAYATEASMRIGNQIVDLSNTSKRPTKQAILSPEAWELYGDFEMKMVEAAAASYYSPLALPTFERLSRSMLKLAVLLAASNCEPDGGSFSVGKQDIIDAAGYIQQWGRYSVDLIMNSGKTQSLRIAEKIRRQIEVRPGIMRTELLRAFHLSSREMNELIATLVDRGEITFQKKGRMEKYWVVQ